MKSWQNINILLNFTFFHSNSFSTPIRYMDRSPAWTSHLHLQPYVYNPVELSSKETAHHQVGCPALPYPTIPYHTLPGAPPSAQRTAQPSPALIILRFTQHLIAQSTPGNKLSFHVGNRWMLSFSKMHQFIYIKFHTQFL